jgi:uncharacterized protein
MSERSDQGLKLQHGEGWIVLQVRVQPRASSEGVAGILDGALKVRLTAPPVEGKANEALRILLARLLDIPRRDVEIVSGGTSRSKRVRLHGLRPEDLEVLASNPDSP